MLTTTRLRSRQARIKAVLLSGEDQEVPPCVDGFR